MADDTRAPLTDSPWFWLIVFSVSALGGLLAIAPKYAIRQAGVELKSTAREEVARRSQAGEPLAEAPAETFDAADQQTPLRVPLWTLGVTIVMLLAAMGLGAWQLRHARH
jgi:hypothetical protein